MKSSECEIVKCTSKPEGGDKGDEDTGIDDSQDLLTEPNPPLFLLPCPGLTGGVPECLDVGLENDVHEGLEEAEDEPAVDHLDVGGRGKVHAHTELELSLKAFYSFKIFTLERAL